MQYIYIFISLQIQYTYCKLMLSVILDVVKVLTELSYVTCKTHKKRPIKKAACHLAAQCWNSQFQWNMTPGIVNARIGSFKKHYLGRIKKNKGTDKLKAFFFFICKQRKTSKYFYRYLHLGVFNRVLPWSFKL